MTASIESIENIPRAKPGPAVGSRHSGMFKPGNDIRRNPPMKRNLMERVAKAAGESAPAAIAFLQEVMEGKEPVRVRLIAAKELLDRAIGQSVNMSVHRDLTNLNGHGENGTLNGKGSNGQNGGGGSNGSGRQLPPPEDMTDGQLLDVIKGCLNNPIGDEPVDAEFTEIAANKAAD